MKRILSAIFVIANLLAVTSIFAYQYPTLDVVWVFKKPLLPTTTVVVRATFTHPDYYMDYSSELYKHIGGSYAYCSANPNTKVTSITALVGKNGMMVPICPSGILHHPIKDAMKGFNQRKHMVTVLYITADDPNKINGHWKCIETHLQ